MSATAFPSIRTSAGSVGREPNSDGLARFLEKKTRALRGTVAPSAGKIVSAPGSNVGAPVHAAAGATSDSNGV